MRSPSSRGDITMAYIDEFEFDWLVGHHATVPETQYDESAADWYCAVPCPDDFEDR